MPEEYTRAVHVGALNPTGIRSVVPRKAKWPAPVIDFLLGKSDPEALLRAAEHPDAETRRGQVCEAQFYVGEWHLLNLRLKDANDLLSRAEKNCPKTFIEYEGAVAELRRMAK